MKCSPELVGVTANPSSRTTHRHLPLPLPVWRSTLKPQRHLCCSQLATRGSAPASTWLHVLCINGHNSRIIWNCLKQQLGRSPYCGVNLRNRCCLKKQKLWAVALIMGGVWKKGGHLVGGVCWQQEEGEWPKSGSEPPTPAVLFLPPSKELGSMASRGVNVCGVCCLLLYVVTVVLGG